VSVLCLLAQKEILPEIFAIIFATLMNIFIGMAVVNPHVILLSWQWLKEIQFGNSVGIFVKQVNIYIGMEHAPVSVNLL